jgi:hypothetical protein
MVLFCFFVFFETLFHIAERLQAMAFVFANPALRDLVYRHGIEVMQLLAPAPDDRDKIRCFEQQQMFRHRLPRHIEVPAQLTERLPVVLVQLVEQLSAALVSQGFEYCVQYAMYYATKWLPVNREIFNKQNIEPTITGDASTGV